jgi:tetratricopeptide (TPR) repeat protein
VAQRIAASLALELLPDQRARLARPAPPYTAAHEDYLRGRYHLHKRTEEGFRAAIACFESALAKDSRYAPAYAGISDTYFLWGSHGLRPPIEIYAKANKAAEKALAIDSRVAQAHSALVFGRTFYDWDFRKAERQDRRAVKLGAVTSELQYYRGIYLAAQGRFDEAIRAMRQALQLDPLFPALNANFCHILTVARRCEAAIEQGELAVSLDPYFWLSRVRLGRAYLLQGDYEKGLAQHEEALRLSGGPPTHLALLAYAYGFVGETRRARQIFADMLSRSRERYVCPYFVAEACVPLGDAERTLDWLEQGVKVRANWISFLGVEPAFDPLRSHPRFNKLLARLGLPRLRLSLPRRKGLHAGRTDA